MRVQVQKGQAPIAVEDSEGCFSSQYVPDLIHTRIGLQPWIH
jgi:hypothetical protein